MKHNAQPRKYWYVACLLPILLLLVGCDTFTQPDVSPPAVEQVDALTKQLAPFKATTTLPLNGVPQACVRTQDASIYQLCMPAPGSWNGGLVVYAHGYVSPFEGLHIPGEADHILESGEQYDISLLVTSLNFAFAVTSYPYNGLVNPDDATADLEGLIDFFAATVGPPALVLLGGVSEGGLIAVRSIEERPDLFDGALATCGPYGDFFMQVNHLGDVRVLFDYFFPHVLPGSPLRIPEVLISEWEETYKPAVIAALLADPVATAEFLAVTGLPVMDPTDPAVVAATVLDVLWYNVFATNDAIVKLGGQPYDNADRIYSGSSDDALLNQKVKRYAAKKKAVQEIEAYYQTSGLLVRPLVIMHTDGDHVVPFAHFGLYVAKAQGPFVGLPVVGRYGHCTFTGPELISAVTTLLAMLPFPPPVPVG
jgi:pimeloyl-ACP methyl ester carboxylesterase